MLYLFHGSDREKVRGKVRSTVAALLKREPDASYVRFDDETLTGDALAEYLGGQGLFAGRVLVVLDGIFEDAEVKELVLEHLKELKESENIFILLEDKLDARTLKKLEKYAEKSQAFDLRTKDLGHRTGKDFNIFSLTDALGNRDSKRAWVEYQRALRAGSRPEEIHGILFWQTKTMLLVAHDDTKDLKPFVVGKAQTFLRNWERDELTALSGKLVDVYHEARMGKFDLALGLERLLLSL